MMSSERKRKGLYYTPECLAKIIVDWAIRDTSSSFFDPCFGRGIFLTSALTRYGALDLKEPSSRLYGVDIDPEMIDILPESVINKENDKHFKTTDFLELRSESMVGAPYEVICGNPPFVRHNYLTERQITKASDALREIGLEASGRSGYWLYFLFHSTAFLAKGGRLGLIVPTSFLYTDYSKDIRSEFFELFREVLIVSVEGRVFDKARENILLILADGYEQKNEYIGFTSADSLSSLKAIITSLRRNRDTHRITDTEVWSLNYLSSEARNILDRSIENEKTLRLGDIAEIGIGVVTGANSFFVLSRDQAEKNEIPERFLSPIIDRATIVKGLKFTKEDFQNLPEGRRKYLLLLGNEPIPESVKNYLQTGIKQKINERYKCKTRHPWFGVQYGEQPDSFLHYMSGSFPHIVANWSGYTSTNTIHRLKWRNPYSKQKEMAVALASISSLAQLSAELYGRSYGGGVLKLEPSEAKRLILPVSGFKEDMIKEFEKAHNLLIQGDKLSACKIADQVFLREFLRLDEKEEKAIQASFLRLMATRKGRSKPTREFP